MRKNKTEKLCCGMLVTVMLLGSMAPCAAYAGEQAAQEREITHGTATEWILPEAVNHTPPADYTVNPATQGEAETGDYSAYFLKDKIQTVHIEIEENNLNYLLQNAADEPYVMTTSVTVGDTTLGYCGLKTKGSYTLQHSVTENEGSDRFSFTVNFGKYIKKKEYGEKQNFFGCDKISFNNFFFDKTMMKEYFALKLMDEMGLPTPEYGLAKLYINGNYYGVYAMVEAMDHSILERYYGVDESELSSYLCKPEGTGFLYEEIQADPSLLWERDEDTRKDVEDMLPTVNEWLTRLNFLSNGMDFNGQTVDVNSSEYPELVNQVLDTEEAVKYFAVHSWLCQMDNMFDGKKNFGLYIDKEGRAVLVPWDYDLSFGCYYPSTAENTANYPLDIMFRMDYGRAGEEAQMAQEVYANFPLFHIIYRNKTLMQKFHNYMLECSKIVTLGGTVASTGKTYDPGYFNTVLETLQEEVLAAATEETAENVYYMNNIRQPNGVKKGMPNLTKIMAMRAVGVANQVNGIVSTVCTYGCDLSALGNAVKGSYQKTGILTSVDPATGIYVTAEYGGGKNASAPVITVTKLTKEDATYDTFIKELDAGEDDLVAVYEISNKGTATGAFILNIPVTQEFLQADGEFKFFTHTGGYLQEFEMYANDNVFTGEVDVMDYIVVTKGTDPGTGIIAKDNIISGEEAEVLDDIKAGPGELSLSTMVAGAVAFLVFAAVVVMAVGKRKK